MTAGALLFGRAADSHPARFAHSPRAAFAVHGGEGSQSRPAKSGPTVVREVAHGSVSASRLRAGLPAARIHRRADREHETPFPARSTRVKDGALQSTAPAQLTPAAIAGFNGVTNADNQFGSVPPDTVGDVGPTRYVEMTNTVWAVYNKTGGPPVAGPFDNQTLWSGLSTGSCKTHDDGDPMVVYDSLADRWVLSQFAVPPNGTAGGFHECIAVSKTSDPAGGYWVYDYLVSTTLFNDYPKLGVWPDGYYMSFNDFDPNDYTGITVAAFPRVQMLQGQKGNGIEFVRDWNVANDYSILPADLDGRLQPPAGSPAIFGEYQKGTIPCATNCLVLYSFHANWTQPNLSTFTSLAKVTTKPFTDLFCPLDCIPQKGTTSCAEFSGTLCLDDLSDRLMNRLAYRNYGGGVQALSVNHTVKGAVDGHGDPTGAVRWYELRKGSTPWAIYQQGTYQPDAGNAYPLSRWMGSVAMDGTHDLAAGYSASSALANPSIRFAGRTPADTLGTLETERIMYAGTGTQDFIDRWGDYTAMSVDPRDDCTFWYLGEYYVSGSDNWRTRVGSFRFPSCVGISQVSPASGATGATVTITGVGFNSTAVVKFAGGVTATKTFVSAAKLTAKVPAGTKSGRITVTQGKNIAYSPASFTVTS